MMLNMREQTADLVFDELLTNVTFRIIRCGPSASTGREYSIRSPFSRVIYQEAGTSHYTFLDHHFALSPGQTMIVPTDAAMHCRLPCGMSVQYAYFRADFAGSADLLALVRPLAFVMKVPDAPALFAEMARRWQGRDLSDRLVAISCLVRLIEPFYRTVNAAGIASTSFQIGRLLPVLRYIDDHLTEFLTVEELASIAHLSPKYFCSLFSSRMGHPPLAYVGQRRIQQAREYLALSDLSIGEIAQRIGFEDQFYFSRKFRKSEGISPREYRERHRQALEQGVRDEAAAS